MRLRRDKRRVHKERTVIVAVIFSSVLVAGLWGLQIKTMVSRFSLSEVADTAEFTKQQIEEGIDFAKELQDASMPSTLSELISGYQMDAQQGLEKYAVRELLADALVAQLDEETLGQELKKSLEESYAEEE
jgi:predicted DNA-binding protein YlxM (UPF0122 family)